MRGQVALFEEALRTWRAGDVYVEASRIVSQEFDEADRDDTERPFRSRLLSGELDAQRSTPGAV
jgi:hypothetical protein